ncbi:MAG: ribonuclease HI family protein [bacterium]|nr:ribonuclease HI family protein [bacterium]
MNQNNNILEKITIYTDGGSRGNPGHAAVGVQIIFPDKEEKHLAQYIGIQTNNYAEYMAVIIALEYLVENNLTENELNFILDSQLVVRQLNGNYKVKEPTIIILHSRVKKLLNHFNKATFTHTLREFNKIADSLVNLALDNKLKIHP